MQMEMESNIRSSDIPLEIIEKFEKLGYKLKGDFGSFYKKASDFVIRIATHDQRHKEYANRTVYTLLYCDISELKNFNFPDFEKLRKKVLRKEENKKRRELEKKVKKFRKNREKVEKRKKNNTKLKEL